MVSTMNVSRDLKYLLIRGILTVLNNYLKQIIFLPPAVIIIIQFNLFHPRIIIHDMGQVKQFPYTILDHCSELQ
jgi:hypothetical protein